MITLRTNCLFINFELLLGFCAICVVLLVNLTLLYSSPETHIVVVHVVYKVLVDVIVLSECWLYWFAVHPHTGGMRAPCIM